MAYTGSSIVDYLGDQKQDSSFAARSALAQKNNIANYTGTADQNIQLLGMLRGSPTPTPKVPTTFDASSLDAGSKVTVPPADQAPPADPFVASLEASTKQFDEAYKAANKAVEPIQQERTNLSTSLQERLQGLLGKGARTTELEAAAGVPQSVKQLQELNTQIAQKTGEFNKASVNLEANAGANGVNLGVLTGQQAAIRRQQAVEVGALTSVAQAVQGNIALAQQTAERTVDLEFADKEQEVKNLVMLLDLNQENLSTAEKKRAEQLSFVLTERQNQIEQAKEDRKQVLNLSAEAAKGGADNLTLSKMSQAKTPDEALAIGGSFLGAEFKAKQVQQAFDNSIETQKLAIEKIKALKTVGNGTGAPSAITQAVIDNPSLINNLTPTVKGQVIAELQAGGYDTSNLGTKALSDAAIKEISQSQEALLALQDLKATISGKTNLLGPLRGFAALNPYSEARRLQANVDLVRQRVGKALEGGVLRKEDEAKYKKILATLQDTPETADYKIDALITSVQRDIETYTSLQQSAGRSLDVKSSLTKKGDTASPPEDLRKKYNY